MTAQACRQYRRFNARHTRAYTLTPPKMLQRKGAKVKVNDLIIREFRSYYEYQAYMFANGLNTIENWLTIPFDETNRYDELLDLRKANSFIIEYSTAAANSITLLLEELKGL